MNFVSTRVITDDMKRLVSFYENALGLAPRWYTDDFAELATPSGTLAIASKRSMDAYGASAAHAADNRTSIMEFIVADVDAEYEKLRKTDTVIAQLPTTQPWGNRSLLFRDPDGNLINFFTPVSEPAIAKYAAVSN
ncbi:VOC family protein [Pararobbsia alpina]|uniref:VOC family protein n=1 Tax=Pararobbsia alpina TaxID=621374 RepID=UPI0039A6BD05